MAGELRGEDGPTHRISVTRYARQRPTRHASAIPCRSLSPLAGACSENSEFLRRRRANSVVRARRRATGCYAHRVPPQKFIWVLGPSGVGKATFVARLLSDPEMRVRFAIDDDVIAFGPGFQGQQKQATPAATLATASSRAVLVKWQAIGDKEIERLHRLRPAAEHHLFLLQRPAVDNHRDLHRRTPTSPETTESIAAFAEKTLRECRERVTRGFRLTIIAAANDRYDIV